MNTPTDPLLQKVLVETSTQFWGTLHQYRGTQADLIAGAVAAPYMFEDISKSGMRTRNDEFGDRYTIRRMARGMWDLCRYADAASGGMDITNSHAQTLKWYPEAKARVDQAMSEIMARIQAGR